nr:unnamed protein product [Rangifer tarandus platyrhynchus]
MDVHTALQEVMKTALIHYGLAHEIREAAKALDKYQAHLCVFASNCDVRLVEALCVEHQINLIKVDDNKKLREWTTAQALRFHSRCSAPQGLLGAPPASGDLSLDSAKRNWDSSIRNTDSNSTKELAELQTRWENTLDRVAAVHPGQELLVVGRLEHGCLPSESPGRESGSTDTASTTAVRTAPHS